MQEAEQFKQLFASWKSEQIQLIEQQKTRLGKAQELDKTELQEFYSVLSTRENMLLREKRVGVKESDFKILKEIGHGAYSTVYLVRKKSNGCIFAMKVINKDKVGKAIDGVRLRTERAIMVDFESPFIVKLYYAFQNEDNLYFIMDFAAGSDISQFLNNCGCVPKAWARLWFAQMLCSVMILHGDDPYKILGVDKQHFDEIINEAMSSQSPTFLRSQINISRSDSVCSVQFEDNTYESQRSKLTLTQLSDDLTLDASSSITPEQQYNQNLLWKSPDFDANLFLSEDHSEKLQAAAFINKKEYIHNDLKPSNMLITAQGRIMLADFGLSKEIESELSTRSGQVKSQKSIVIHQSETMESAVVGTINYLAPEQLQQGICGKFVDFFALGCILYEMLIGELAISGANQDEIIHKLATCSYDQLIPPRYDLDDDSWDLVTNLMACPEERYGRSSNIQQLLSHRFFTLGHPVECVAYAQHQQLQNALKGKQINYDELPILPLPDLLVKIEMPWKPRLENEEDLQYFVKSNIFDAFPGESSSSVEDPHCSQLGKRQVQFNVSDLEEGHSGNNSEESEMSQSVLDMRQCNPGFMEKVVVSPIMTPKIDDKMAKFAGIDYTGEDGNDTQRLLSLEQYMREHK